MNSLMTGGRHHAWRRLVTARRRAGARRAGARPGHRHGDLALAIREADPRRLVVGADFARRHAASRAREVRKARRAAASRSSPPTRWPCPSPDHAFAAVTSAFLLRNLDDLERGLREMRRVTRPGGLVLTLDIVRPGVPAGTRCSRSIFNRVVPAIGAVVAGDRTAYTYLPDSVERFVTPRRARAPDGAASGLRDVRLPAPGPGHHRRPRRHGLRRIP